MNEEKLKA